jgi:FtsP/CotA-like multicopper oxidase with cupredoxin domain
MGPEARLPMHDQKAQPMHHAAYEHGGMGGLVVGFTVEGATKPEAVVQATRRLKLFVRPREGSYGVLRGASFQVQDGDKEPPADKVPVVGEPLILTRGETTEIDVINQLKDPTVVHWHGIELESYYDGVAGWTGSSKMMTPPVPPGGSFVARMTPRHAGTYIYHTHWHDEEQIRSGLAGPLLVLNPGEKYDPESDKIFLITVTGQEGPQAVLTVNGHPQPRPVRLIAGRKYRLRFVNITPNAASLRVTLMNGNESVKWRAVGKDGDALPPAQAVWREARQFVAVGETYDFELHPQENANLMLEFHIPALGGRWVMQPIHVRRTDAREVRVATNE